MKLKFLVTATLAFAFMIAGNSAYAVDSATDVVSIEAVPVVISADNSQPGAVVSFTRTLRRGANSLEVLELQKKLQAMGYYTKALDSDYGPATFSAVHAYQLANSLSADGIAGARTFAKILSSGGSYTLPPVTDPNYACGTSLTDAYSPVCGQLTLNCVTSPCPQPAPRTFANKCVMTAAGASYLYSGTCDLTKPVEDDDSEVSDISIQKRIELIEAQIKRLENYIDDLEVKIKKLKELL